MLEITTEYFYLFFFLSILFCRPDFTSIFLNSSLIYLLLRSHIGIQLLEPPYKGTF